MMTSHRPYSDGNGDGSNNYYSDDDDEDPEQGLAMNCLNRNQNNNNTKTNINDPDDTEENNDDTYQDEPEPLTLQEEHDAEIARLKCLICTFLLLTGFWLAFFLLPFPATVILVGMSAVFGSLYYYFTTIAAAEAALALAEEEENAASNTTTTIQQQQAQTRKKSSQQAKRLLRHNAHERQRQAQSQQGTLANFAQAIRDIEENNGEDEEEDPDDPYATTMAAATTKFPPPTSGIYQIIYAAEMYGRVVRSEGHVHWKFEEHPNTTASSGATSYKIQGKTVTKLQRHACPITRGHWNGATGQMYWITPSSVQTSSDNTSENNNNKAQQMMLYKGTLDTRIHELFDGDFISSDGTLSGRIVRVSLVEATEDIELVEDTSTDNTQQDNTDQDTAEQDAASQKTVPTSNTTTATTDLLAQQDWGSLGNDIELVARGQVTTTATTNVVASGAKLSA